MPPRRNLETLVKLSETDLTVADAEQDIRGRAVVDENGEHLGTVEDLLIDTTHKKVRFLDVGSGGFLGIGEKTIIIPVDAISDIGEDKVVIRHSRGQVANAPRYVPELADDAYLHALYGYFGYAPYWAPGYICPPFPDIF